ncbi:MAG: (2Fe-2S)-binding protein [Bacteroidales bacterium]|nr:(2Fe-2S)-binding protein [Bacteroidales bacterium]
MKIYIDGKGTEVRQEETLLEICRRNGIPVPSLCYAEGAVHRPSCMVCMVMDEATGQMLPSCSTHPAEGMRIVATGAEVSEMRALAVDLLLSDHRADCEAPCTTVCPQHLNVEGVLSWYDQGDYARARSLLAAVFPLPETGCGDCKAPCEKVCRRGTVDSAVSIREILRRLAEMDIPVTADPAGREVPDKAAFSSRLGAFSPAEKLRLARDTKTPSRCLHCACLARHDCRLRDAATAFGLRTPEFGVRSELPFKERRTVAGCLVFEPAKCIHCGLCVYNTEDGFTFRGRGFSMQVVLPEESRGHVREDVAALCPTGALCLEG